MTRHMLAQSSQRTPPPPRASAASPRSTPCRSTPTMSVPGSRWKKLRLYEVLPFTGHPGDFGPERRLNMPDSL
eukprot:7442072-Alexandrium_andersonii.AAC.1